jgi:signal transduction histidine kinase
MMPRLSLTLRTFLFSFVPVCIVLACCFAAVNAAIKNRIRLELREQLQASDRMLDQINTEWSNRTSALVSKLSDSAGLKAAVGLLAEGHRDPQLAAQVRNTIEAQLRELQASSTFDLLAVADLNGRTVAMVGCPACSHPSSQSTIPIKPGLAEVDHVLYQFHPLPIDIGGETSATLVLGSSFDTGKIALPGYAVLMRAGKVISSTLPRKWDGTLEEQIANHCATLDPGCEANLGLETYVVSRLQKGQIGSGYALLGLRSLDESVRDFETSFLETLLTIAAAGVLLALLCTIFTSRSVSRPLRALVTQLNHTEASGDLSERLTAGGAVRELALLADAYNRVADSAQRTRRQLEIAKDAAQSANRLKDEFLTNVSHELRTPLNGVLGMTGLLLETNLDSDQQDFATTVRQSGEALVTIIDDILTFSQLQTGRLTLAAQVFDFEKILTEFLKWTVQRAETKPIHVEMEYPHSAPRRFVGDETYLRQILRHLCDNAVKFTDSGSIRITFRCELESNGSSLTRVSVEDTGIGIAPAAHDQVFERFTQTDGSLTRQRGGTGLGLALAKALVQLMGGTIGVESKLGEGSHFWFVLPLQRPFESAGMEPGKIINAGVIPC